MLEENLVEKYFYNLEKNYKSYDWYETVLLFRQETQDEFPWPSNTACVMYAITEVGEMIDKYLRQQRPDDIRANDRDSEGLLEEIADVLMMVLSVKVFAYGFIIPNYRNTTPKDNAIVENVVSYLMSDMAILLRTVISDVDENKEQTGEDIQNVVGNCILFARSALKVTPAELYVTLCRRLYKRCKKIGWTDEKFLGLMEICHE